MGKPERGGQIDAQRPLLVTHTVAVVARPLSVPQLAHQSAPWTLCVPDLAIA